MNDQAKRLTNLNANSSYESPAPIPALINAREAAAMLAIGARSLWSYTKCHAIPSRKIGRSVRYVPAELLEWVDMGCPTDPGAADRVRASVRKRGRADEPTGKRLAALRAHA